MGYVVVEIYLTSKELREIFVANTCFTDAGLEPILRFDKKLNAFFDGIPTITNANKFGFKIERITELLPKTPEQKGGGN